LKSPGNEIVIESVPTGSSLAGIVKVAVPFAMRALKNMFVAAVNEMIPCGRGCPGAGVTTAVTVNGCAVVIVEADRVTLTAGVVMGIEVTWTVEGFAVEASV
jgi:hypothetical protein